MTDGKKNVLLALLSISNKIHINESFERRVAHSHILHYMRKEMGKIASNTDSLNT